jgi:hypothetical protein
VHSGIHALSSRRAVHVRRVSGEKHALRAIIRDLALIDGEARQPYWIARCYSFGAASLQDLLDLFKCWNPMLTDSI